MSYIKDYAIDLENENKELKENKKVIYDTACELVWYLEENDKEMRDKEKIDEYIATIQNYSK